MARAEINEPNQSWHFPCNINDDFVLSDLNAAVSQILLVTIIELQKVAENLANSSVFHLEHNIVFRQ